MKKTKFISVVIVILMLFSGCSVNSDANEPVTEIAAKVNYIEKYSDFDVKEDYRLVFDGEIIIYKINRDVFNCFMKKQLHTILKDNCESENVYSKDGKYLYTMDITRVEIDNTLISFMGSKDNVYKYISSNGVADDVENMAVFDAPYSPLTLWLSAGGRSYFVTIGEETTHFPPYVYRFYSCEEYIEKYGCKKGEIYLNGKLTETEIDPDVYYKYADVPLLSILSNLGAELEYKENKVDIKINGGKYILDLEELSLHNKYNNDKGNLFHINGGPTFVYRSGNEIMVDTAILNWVLTCMDAKSYIKINGNKIFIDLRE